MAAVRGATGYDRRALRRYDMSVPYHIRVTPKSDRSRDEVRLDLTKEDLERRFLRPYAEGRPIVVGGRTISSDDIERVRITYTDESATQLLPLIRAGRQSGNAIAAGITDEWYVASRGRDVTDDLIEGPPGYARTVPSHVDIQSDNAAEGVVAGPDRKSVFVVHGRNIRARDAMFTFLRSLGLTPLEFVEATLATGRPTPYVGDILNAAFDRARAVVVLLTPDDEARLHSDLRSPMDSADEAGLSRQARANVLFEAGMAMGRDESRTVLVELGDTRAFSDVGGRLVLKIDNSSQRRQELAMRLRAAGCDVNMIGTDWHSAGDFDAALTLPRADPLQSP